MTPIREPSPIKALPTAFFSSPTDSTYASTRRKSSVMSSPSPACPNHAPPFRHNSSQPRDGFPTACHQSRVTYVTCAHQVQTAVLRPVHPPPGMTRPRRGGPSRAAYGDRAPCRGGSRCPTPGGRAPQSELIPTLVYNLHKNRKLL